MAKAIIIAAAYEDLIVGGRPITEWESPAEGFALCGKRRRGSAVWMVVPESSQAREVALPRPKGLSGRAVGASVQKGSLQKVPAPTGKIRLAPGDVRVYVIRG